MNEHIGATIKEFKDRLNQVFVELNSINASINLFKNLIHELSEKYQEIDVLRSLNERFESHINIYRTNCISLIVQYETLKQELNGCRINLDKTSEDIVNTNKRIDDHIYLFDSFANSNETKLRFMEENFINRINQQKKEFESAISKLQKELLVSPASVFEQNNEVMKKLESASLDGTNSMMKVNNMDMNIRIIEKKIENLSIQIKKIELSQAL